MPWAGCEGPAARAVGCEGPAAPAVGWVGCSHGWPLPRLAAPAIGRGVPPRAWNVDLAPIAVVPEGSLRA